jgi:hypothetical protein
LPGNGSNNGYSSVSALKSSLNGGFHSEFFKVKVIVTLRLAAYRQSVHLGAKPLETRNQRFFLAPESLR